MIASALKLNNIKYNRIRIKEEENLYKIFKL